MQRKRFGIKTTGTTFVTGEYFPPSWDDLHAVVVKLWKLGLLTDLVPEIKVPLVLAHRGPMYRTVPTLLKQAYFKEYHKKAPFEVQALLWVVACFNYRYCGGPYPGTIKRTRRPKGQSVLEFKCPMCGRKIFDPNPRFKSRSVILKQYSSAIRNHADECERLLYLAPEVTL